jgi:hypothetical protein
MVRGMKHYIYTCEADGSEAPLVMADGRIIEFESEDRADAFLNALKNSSIFAEETEEFQEFTNIAYVKSAIVYCDDGYIDADAAEIEIFGCVLSENFKMTEKIEELLDKHYLIDAYESWGYEEYGIFSSDEDWKRIHVADAIRNLFVENGFDKKDYIVKCIEVYDSPDLVASALSITWFEGKELKNLTYPVYC